MSLTLSMSFLGVITLTRRFRDWSNPLFDGAAVSDADPFKGSVNGEFASRMQPNILYWMQNDVQSAWLTAVYMSDLLSREGSAPPYLNIEHTFPVSSDPTWQIPVMPIQDYIDFGWRDPGNIIPDEMSWYVGMEWQEISGDPAHSSLASLINDLNETGGDWAAVDPSILAQWLMETNGYLNPLMWTNLLSDKAWKSWMVRPKQPWLSSHNETIWTANPGGLNVPPPLSPSSPLSSVKKYSGVINPVVDWANNPHATGASGNVASQTHFVGPLPLALNSCTNSISFMLHVHGDHSLVTAANPTRIHVGSPTALSPIHHPRASWASHLHRAIQSVTNEWNELYDVQLEGLIGAGWMGSARLIWHTLDAMPGFAEQFLTYTIETRSLGSSTDSNPVMLCEYMTNPEGVGFIVPSLQFHESLPSVSGTLSQPVMNYIPAKYEYSTQTLDSTATIAPVIDAHLIFDVKREILTVDSANGDDYDIDVPGVTSVDEIVMSNTVDHSFSLFAPYAIDKQTVVTSEGLEPYEDPNWVQISPKMVRVAFSLSPDASGHVVQADGSFINNQLVAGFGDSTDLQRWHAFLWQGGAVGKMVTALHTPVIAPGSGYLQHLDVAELNRHAFDGSVYTLLHNGIIHYLELEALTDDERFTVSGAPGAFDASELVYAGWTIASGDDFFLLIDEYSGALNIYLPDQPGFENGLVFSELDNRLTSVSPDKFDSLVTCRGSLVLAHNKGYNGLLLDSGDRVILPEEETFDFESLAESIANLFGGGN